ncbi:PREDICTED: alpha-ketoglutarate-dependent dioxygenase alkB homolog 7, mitochondrial isoform X2 [Acromyrmex echinatior]|uniref:Alkylated DNA repair protein alkB-like protein 7 n=2 Tax=Acromyrmex echinatior TaxID=103372 RepID=F4W8N5_ACREC|nr:PREDICTED: alpha-ketoglutarate-dependent dioxygenase alkB homolog 7, mitochondrial isoform X2 [Acromyrmex echinatior]XP_011068434.1 PREDICTED: alpha-ketoglutarate-dependent dioxygenase alkB homolog 7, mitochondrial isoform X2 [Acromyrmex echinatior]EGI69526.1 Alkylated DNA repair protein alkB-like protein 7 [Acromyrmex echinatior]
MAITMRLLFRNINRAFYCSTSKHNINSNSEKTISSNDAIKDWRVELYDTMKVLPNFISEKEEDILIQEVDPYMKRLRYEFSHWDNAIHGYRETEWKKWSKDSSQILDRVRRKAFSSEMIQLSLVHILDLAPEGWIKPHIDSVRFCGGIIAGLSLLSDSVMRLAMEGHEEECVACFLLPRRSLYIMSGIARYKYNHEILKSEESYFEGRHVPKGRRISIICRTEADPKVT